MEREGVPTNETENSQENLKSFSLEDLDGTNGVVFRTSSGNKYRIWVHVFQRSGSSKRPIYNIENQRSGKIESFDPFVDEKIIEVGKPFKWHQANTTDVVGIEVIKK